MHNSNEGILDDLRGARYSYLACPYTHDSPAVEEHRATAATRLATWLTERYVTVFSPLTQSKEMVEQGARDGISLPTEYDFWQKHDRAFVSLSSALVILALEGWAQSTGVTDEIHTALDNSLPVFLAIPHPPESGDERYSIKRAPYSIDGNRNEVDVEGHVYTEPFEYAAEEVAEDAITLKSLGFDPIP